MLESAVGIGALDAGGPLGVTRWPWQVGRTYNTTWYQPLKDGDAIHITVSWVLRNAAVFLINGSDIHLLPRMMDAASRAKTDQCGDGAGAAEPK